MIDIGVLSCTVLFTSALLNYTAVFYTIFTFAKCFAPEFPFRDKEAINITKAADHEQSLCSELTHAAMHV